MKNLFSFLVTITPLLFACNNKAVEEDSNKQEIQYDTAPKYDYETGEYLGDTLVPISSENLIPSTNQTDSIPMYEDKKRIGWMVNNKFVPRQEIKSLHPAAYYDSVWSKEVNFDKAKR